MSLRDIERVEQVQQDCASFFLVFKNLIAIRIVNPAMGLNAINEMTRHGGFAPCQWVLSKLPRAPATQGDEEEFADIGAIQSRIDGPTAFALQGKYRQRAREANCATLGNSRLL